MACVELEARARFFISFLKLNQLQAKSLSEPSNFVQIRFLSDAEANNLGQILVSNAS